MLTMVNRIVTLAMVLEAPGSLPYAGIVGGEHAAFTTGGKDLVLAERESADIAHGANLSPLILRPDRLGAVFNDPDSMFARKFYDGIHVARPACEMNRDHCLSARRQRRADGFGSDYLANAIDIGDDRLRTAHRHTACGGDKSTGWNNDFVTGTDAQGAQC